MEASRDFSRTPPHLPPCSDVSVLQKTRMSHFWDTHHHGASPLGTPLIAAMGWRNRHRIFDRTRLIAQPFAMVHII